MMLRVRGTGALAASAALAGLLNVGVTACSDDDDELAAPSTAEFCSAMHVLDQGDDAGPYAVFYDQHPDPTPADWAADGHLVTESIQTSIDQIRTIRPSEDAKPLMEDTLAAMEVVKQNSLDVSTAGENDDQAEIDELERVNQDTNVPALMASIEAVAELCGASAGS